MYEYVRGGTVMPNNPQHLEYRSCLFTTLPGNRFDDALQYTCTVTVPFGQPAIDLHSGIGTHSMLTIFERDARIVPRDTLPVRQTSFNDGDYPDRKP